MTRDDIKKHFPEATDDQISALLDINSKDIGKHKTAAETAAADLKKANDTIADLNKNKADADALQKIIDDYKAADQKRQADERAAAERAEHESRFNKVLGEREFAHDYIRQGVFADFEKALADEKNKGKGDSDIFDALVKDDKGVKPGLCKPQTGGGGGVPGTGGVPSSDQAFLQAMYKNNPFFEG